MKKDTINDLLLLAGILLAGFAVLNLLFGDGGLL